MGRLLGRLRGNIYIYIGSFSRDLWTPKPPSYTKKNVFDAYPYLFIDPDACGSIFLKLRLTIFYGTQIMALVSQIVAHGAHTREKSGTRCPILTRRSHPNAFFFAILDSKCVIFFKDMLDFLTVEAPLGNV